jgi:pimeloyl-ACP methyl ester carboxylesterase
VPLATIDGLRTRYEVVGSGPPLLMFSPGGFDATIEKWSTLGVYARVKPLEHLAKKYSCIVFDRRETGQSGGRVERVGWEHYVAQGVGLLDHLGIERAHLMGGCMGCAPVTAFAVAHPSRALSMILWWPVGGARYRIKGQQRFAEHLAFVQQNGLQAVVDLVKREGKAFGADPRGGPWASPIKSDPAFAAEYAGHDLEAYKLVVAGMARVLLDRDTAPGAEPEDLMRLATPALIVPGKDESHATSAARYLEECLPKSQYWDAAPAAQTEEAAAQKLLQFLESASTETVPA